MLKICDLSLHLPSGQALIDRITVDVPQGKTVALVGQSGSGKSLTALSVLRLLPWARYPTGQILWTPSPHEGAQSMVSQDPYSSSGSPQDKTMVDLLQCSQAMLCQVRTGQIGFVFQEPSAALNPLMTVKEHLLTPLLHHRVCLPNQCLGRIQELLDLVGFSQGKQRLDAYPHQLSGGQRQRLMMAMALSCRPRLLIADEPTTALDMTLQIEILTTLRRIQQTQGMGMLLISHDLIMVQHVADYVYIMHQGRVVEHGSTQSLFSNPVQAYTKTLLASRDLGRPTVLQPMPARVMTIRRLDVDVPGPRQVLWRRQRINIVRNVSFTLHQGETLAIVGESGAGKSTLANALIHLVKARGEMDFEGVDFLAASKRQRAPLRRHIQMIFQDPIHALNPRWTVQAIVGEGIDVHKLASHPQQKAQQVMRALADVDLGPELAFRYPHQLSGGQRQRVAIARALVVRPKVLILDEPTSALDPMVQREIVQLLKRLQTNHGLSYLFITHDLDLVRALAHQVMILRRGCVVEKGETHQVFTTPTAPYTRQLLDASLWHGYSAAS